MCKSEMSCSYNAGWERDRASKGAWHHLARVLLMKTHPNEEICHAVTVQVARVCHSSAEEVAGDELSRERRARRAANHVDALRHRHSRG